MFKSYWPAAFSGGIPAAVALGVAGALLATCWPARADVRLERAGLYPPSIKKTVIGRSRLGVRTSPPAARSERRDGGPGEEYGQRPRGGGARGGVVADGATPTRAEVTATLGEAAAAAFVVALALTARWSGILSGLLARWRLLPVAGRLAPSGARHADRTPGSYPVAATKRVFAALRSTGKRFRKIHARRDGAIRTRREEVQQI